MIVAVCIIIRGAFTIENLIPDARSVSNSANILGIYIGVDDLYSGFILPLLNSLEILIRHYQIHNALRIVLIDFYLVGVSNLILTAILGGLLSG